MSIFSSELACRLPLKKRASPVTLWVVVATLASGCTDVNLSEEIKEKELTGSVLWHRTYKENLEGWITEWEQILLNGKRLEVVTIGEQEVLEQLHSKNFLEDASAIVTNRSGIAVQFTEGRHFSTGQLFDGLPEEELRKYGDSELRVSGATIPHDNVESLTRRVKCTYLYEQGMPGTMNEIVRMADKIRENWLHLRGWKHYRDLAEKDSLWLLNASTYGLIYEDLIEFSSGSKAEHLLVIANPLVDPIPQPVAFSRAPLIVNPNRWHTLWGTAPIFWATKEGSSFLRKFGLGELDDDTIRLGLMLTVARAVFSLLDIPLFRSDATANRGCLSDFTPLDPSPTASWQRIADVDTCPEERRLVEFQVSYLKAMHDLLSGSTELSRDFTVAYKEFYPKLEPLGQHRYAEIAFGYAIATGDMEEAAYFAPYLDLCLETFTTERSRYEFLFIGFSEDVRGRYTAFLRRYCAEFAKKCPEDIQPGILPE